MQDEMKFSKYYSKLSQPYFTSIRKKKKGRARGQLIPMNVNGKIVCIGKIKAIYHRTLSLISDELLLKDTDCSNRKEVYELFQSFYENKIDFEKDKFYIFHFERFGIKSPNNKGLNSNYRTLDKFQK